MHDVEMYRRGARTFRRIAVYFGSRINAILRSGVHAIQQFGYWCSRLRGTIATRHRDRRIGKYRTLCTDCYEYFTVFNGNIPRETRGA